MNSYLAAAAAAVTWMLTSTIFLSLTSASGDFQVQLMSLNNVDGRNVFGLCCSEKQQQQSSSSSSSSSSRHSPCVLPCRTYFRICLSHYQASIPDVPGCTYGEHVTPILANNSYLHEGREVTGHGSPSGAVFNSSAGDVRLPFSFTWPTTFSLIVEALHKPEESSSGRTGGPSNLIMRVAIQGTQYPGKEKWKEMSQRNGTIRLAFRYRVVCSEGYYGNGCSEMCKPRDDKFGHYKCSENGTKVCLQGWSGQYCDKVICLPGCNESYGTCEEPNECRCRLGWQGPTCSTCIPYPGCQHGTCNVPWKCNCDDGWGGLFCNQDLNFCTNHRPCRNGATCINTGHGSYTCLCPDGFTGTNCEIERKDCRPTNKSCLNKGNCTQITLTEYECQCPAGFYGRRCELRIAGGCGQEPCLNSGTCLSQSGGVQRYKCNCVKGFTGINCEQKVDECKSQPCLNGGSCIDELNDFRCVCPPGFSGQRCQNSQNYCADSPCLNGGICIDKVDDFECRCRPGFVGPLCQDDVDECLYNPCANGGTCYDLPNGFRCICTPGFTGKSCTIKVDMCTSQPCRNGATCVPSVNTYQCACAQGYFGDRCELPTVTDTGSPAPDTTFVAALDAVESTAMSNKSTEGTVSQTNSGGAQQLITQDISSLTVHRVVLIACLGVGLTIMFILAAILFLVIRRHRRESLANRLTFTEKENEDNQRKRLNNKNSQLELDAQNTTGGGGGGNSIYLNLIDSKQTQRKSNSNCSQQNLVNVHKTYSGKQNNLRRLSYKDVNIDLEV